MTFECDEVKHGCICGKYTSKCWPLQKAASNGFHQHAEMIARLRHSDETFALRSGKKLVPDIPKIPPPPPNLIADLERMSKAFDKTAEMLLAKLPAKSPQSGKSVTLEQEEWDKVLMGINDGIRDYELRTSDRAQPMREIWDRINKQTWDVLER